MEAVPGLPSGLCCKLVDALFCTMLMPSDEPSHDVIRTETLATLHRYGAVDCSLQVGKAIGRNPRLALERLAWCETATVAAFDLDLEEVQP